jgi:hypothetical protein
MLNRSSRSLLAALLWLLFSNANAYTLEGVKWGNPTFGTGASITWSLIDNVVACDDTFISCEETTVTPINSFLPSGFEDEIRRAFDTWAAVADLTFTEITDGNGAFGDNTDPASYIADIRFGGMYIDGASGNNTLGYAYYPYTSYAAAGDVILDSGNNFSILSAPGPGIDIFTLVLHELGHSLGIGHTDIIDAVMYPNYSFATGLSPDDIAAVQELYGPATVVPLPAAVWLMLSGLGLLSMTSRRQRGKAT